MDDKSNQMTSEDCDDEQFLEDFKHSHPSNIDWLNDKGFQWYNSSILKPVVDWNKLQYQNTYKSTDYVASKFSGDWSNIPGFDKVIEQMSVRQLTPLEEMQERYNVAINHNEQRDHSNIPEFKDCQ